TAAALQPGVIGDVEPVCSRAVCFPETPIPAGSQIHGDRLVAKERPYHEPESTLEEVREAASRPPSVQAALAGRELGPLADQRAPSTTLDLVDRGVGAAREPAHRRPVPSVRGLVRLEDRVVGPCAMSAAGPSVAVSRYHFFSFGSWA